MNTNVSDAAMKDFAGGIKGLPLTNLNSLQVHQRERRRHQGPRMWHQGPAAHEPERFSDPQQRERRQLRWRHQGINAEVTNVPTSPRLQEVQCVKPLLADYRPLSGDGSWADFQACIVAAAVYAKCFVMSPVKSNRKIYSLLQFFPLCLVIVLSFQCRTLSLRLLVILLQCRSIGLVVAVSSFQFLQSSVLQSSSF